MKARWIPVFLAIIALALPARAEVFHPAFDHPDGQKKVGQYVWVWATKTIMTTQPVQVDCPVDYVVTGGGFTETNGFPVDGSRPNTQVDGWVADVRANATNPNKVTVYAGCAPAK